MKKIKGGKREGAGRKKTGRNTEVVSFSVPKNLVSEIKKMVKDRLIKPPKSKEKGLPLPEDFVDHKGNIAVVDESGKVVIPNLADKIKNDPINKRISELRNELKNPPKNPMIGLRKWIIVRENEIKELQQQLTQ